MSKTFNTTAKINKVKEPIFQVNRAKYRAARSSQQENLETNQIKLDLTRIYQELETIDLSILDEITIFIGNKVDETDTTYLTDGLSYEVSGVGFALENTVIDQTLELDTIGKLSGILTRLYGKVQRLETRM